jgi:hypothetical protein
MEFLTKNGTHNNPVLKKVAVIIFIALLIIGFTFGLEYQSLINSSQVTQNQKPLLEAPTIKPMVTPPPRVSLQIPLNDNWIMYNANCPGLKNDITIYYPRSWKIGKYGEEKISAECQIILGYPFSPGGHQNSLVDGQGGEIRIGSYLAQGKTLNDLYEEEYKSENNNQMNNVKSIYITDIANRKWIKTVYFDSSSVFNTIRLQTVYKDRIYDTSYSVIVDEGKILDDRRLDASSSGHLFAIGEKFVSSLEFH